MDFDVNACGASLMPCVTELHGVSVNGSRRFRLEGGDLAPGWSPRPGEEAWCEVTVLPDGRVTAFGGMVWPAAWPDLFRIGPRTIYGQPTNLTALGRKLFGMDTADAS